MNVVSGTSARNLKSCCDHSITIVHYDVFSQAGFMLSVFVFKVAWWRSGYSVGLAINRSRVQILLGATLRNNLGQVVHTYVPLSPSSIT